MSSSKAILAQCFALGLALASFCIPDLGNAQNTTASEGPSRAQIEALLEQVDALIEQNDARLAMLDDQISATTDTVQQQRLEGVITQWTRALDGLEEQRSMLIEFLSVLPEAPPGEESGTGSEKAATGRQSPELGNTSDK